MTELWQYEKKFDYFYYFYLRTYYNLVNFRQGDAVLWEINMTHLTGRAFYSDWSANSCVMVVYDFCLKFSHNCLSKARPKYFLIDNNPRYMLIFFPILRDGCDIYADCGTRSYLVPWFLYKMIITVIHKYSVQSSRIVLYNISPHPDIKIKYVVPK